MNDLQGRICVVTGGTSGIGESSAAALARRGAEVAIVCRSAARGEATQQAIESAAGRPCVKLFQADFERLADVRRVAEELAGSLPRVDVLLNNAGVTMLSRSETPDGYETTFAVNHLAPFLLTNLLMPKLLAQPGARIVNVASHAHRFAWFDLDDLHSRKRYSSLRVYGGSKLANILFTNELASRIGERDLRVWSVHPGAVATRLGANNGALAKILLPVLALFFKTPDQGAATSIHLCADESIGAKNGTYFADLKPVALSGRATDADLARRLWTESEKLVGLEAGTGSIWR
ncbi:MAG: SDR family oxidoreductase [Deltaproteobacteria bacterium]|nr:SDR family oxidoreductase [Deltaproteobacteria bacterium]